MLGQRLIARRLLRGCLFACLVVLTPAVSASDLEAWLGALAHELPRRVTPASDAAGAVNGRRTGHYEMHTDRDVDPWWQVDLGGEFPIARVLVDCPHCPERTEQMKLRISRDGRSWSDVAVAPGNQARVDFRIGPALARFVRLQARGEPAALQELDALWALRREALLANPLLDFPQMIVLRRRLGEEARSAMGAELGVGTRNSHTNDSLRRTGWDNELAIVSDVPAQPKWTTLFQPDGGRILKDVDVDFDGRHIMFSSISHPTTRYSTSAFVS